MLIIDNGNFFKVKIEFQNIVQFRDHVSTVKSMPGSSYLPKEKVWMVPETNREQIKQLEQTHNARMFVPEGLQHWVSGEIPALPELDMDLPLKGELRPYQRQGVARGLELKKFINGDEPGLGKTLQSIATLVAAHQKGEDVYPALVICPSSLKLNWQREWHQFSNVKAMVLSDKVLNTWQQYYVTGMAQVFIVNYESLRKYFVTRMPSKDKLNASRDIELRPVADLFKSIIIDEVHRCKDPHTIQSKVCIRLALFRNYRIGLTGTPVVNKPADLYPQLAIIGQLENLGGKKYFLERYCEGGKGANNLKELNYILNSKCFFRREKKDVLKDLPDKQRQTILCEISTRAEYNKAKHALMEWLKANGFTDGQINKSMKGEALVRMNKLLEISAKGKLNDVEEFTREILESGQKLVLFCTLYDIVDKVKAIFPHAVTINGKDTLEQRQRNIDAFQNDPAVNLIICNIQAAGVGITLTASSRVAFIQFPWTFAACIQAEDRCHRLGQKDSVMCTYFLGQDTIDERVFELIQEKKTIANAVTAGTDDMEMETIDKAISIFNL